MTAAERSHDLERKPTLRVLQPGDAVQVRDSAGRLLFEHIPSENRSVVHVPMGDLTLRADAGRIELEARDGVHLRAPGAASVAVEPGVVRVVAPVIEAAAARAEGNFSDAKIVTRTLAIAADRLVTTVGLLETRANRIVERAKASYREVEDIAQVRAGRLRWVARATVSVLGQRAVLRAVKDFKILGEKIHLA